MRPRRVWRISCRIPAKRITASCCSIRGGLKRWPMPPCSINDGRRKLAVYAVVAAAKGTNDVNRSEKARRFAKMHEGPKPFVIPNPWDAGTAKMLVEMGYEALTTTSHALAFGLGRVDGTRSVSRAEALANAKA